MKTDAATQTDIDALTALNRDYIQSVQNGDVRRFDEILADDFLCSNPNALVDKSQFLAQTARPVTISGLTAEEVKVRIIGDVATLSVKLSKPLSARLMPAPGTKPGDRTAFGDPNLVDTVVQPLP